MNRTRRTSMRKTVVQILIALGLLAPLWVAVGCGGQESMGERRRRSRAELKSVQEEAPGEADAASGTKDEGLEADSSTSDKDMAEGNEASVEGEEAEATPD